MQRNYIKLSDKAPQSIYSLLLTSQLCLFCPVPHLYVQSISQILEAQNEIDMFLNLWICKEEEDVLTRRDR